MSADWLALVVVVGFVWATVFGMWPLDRLRERLFESRNPALCHKSNHAYSWAGYAPCDCGKRPNHWVHWPKRLEPHKFEAHIRKDVTGNWPTKLCQSCNKRDRYKMHKLPIPVKDRVAELERWHDDFRLRHPELEDKVRNELFPELCPKDPAVHEMMSEEEMNYRLGMGL